MEKKIEPEEHLRGSAGGRTVTVVSTCATTTVSDAATTTTSDATRVPGNVDARSAADNKLRMNLDAFQQGLELCKKKEFDRGLDMMSTALEERVEACGKWDELELAPLHFQYGLQYLMKSEADGNIFGDAVMDAVESRAAAVKRSLDVDADEDDDDANQDDDEQGVESAASDGDATDAAERDDAPSALQLAWENVEIARVIWERDTEAHAQELLRCHSVAADILLEEGSLVEAQKTLEKAIDFAGKHHASPRLLADMHFRLGMAASTLADSGLALAMFKKAHDILRREKSLVALRVSLESRGTDEAEAAQADSRAAAVELREIDEIIGELEAKISDATEQLKAELSAQASLVDSKKGEATQTVSGVANAAEAGMPLPSCDSSSAPPPAGKRKLADFLGGVTGFGKPATHGASASASAPVNILQPLSKRPR